jgi:hypothetical protein
MRGTAPHPTKESTMTSKKEHHHMTITTSTNLVRGREILRPAILGYANLAYADAAHRLLPNQDYADTAAAWNDAYDGEDSWSSAHALVQAFLSVYREEEAVSTVDGLGGSESCSSLVNLLAAVFPAGIAEWSEASQ